MEVPQHRLNDAVLWPNSSPVKLYPGSLSGRPPGSTVTGNEVRWTHEARSTAVQRHGLSTVGLSRGQTAADGAMASSPLRSAVQTTVALDGTAGSHMATNRSTGNPGSWHQIRVQGAAAAAAAGTTVLHTADHLLNTGAAGTADENRRWCSSLEKQRSCALITMQQRIAALEQDLVASTQRQAQQARQMAQLRQQHQQELLSLQAGAHEQHLQWRRHLADVAARKRMQRLLRNALRQWHQLCHPAAGGLGSQEAAAARAAGAGAQIAVGPAGAAPQADEAQQEQQVTLQETGHQPPALQPVIATIGVSCSTSSLAALPRSAQGAGRAAAWAEGRMLHQTLQAWHVHCQLQRRGRHQLAKHQRRRLRDLLEAWKDHVCCSRRRQLAASILQGVQRQVQLSRGWVALRLHQLEQQLAAWLAARRQHAALRAWLGRAFRSRQDELVVLAQRARAQQRVLARAWQGWLDWVQAERRQALQLQLLQEQEAAAAAGTACAALQVQLEAQQQRLQLMEQQQSRVLEDAHLACAATVPGLQLLPHLEWEPPQYDPALLRARHMTLPVHVTHSAQSATTTRGTLSEPAAAGDAGASMGPQALLVLGGVQGDDWSIDAVLIQVQRSQLGQPPSVLLETVEQQIMQPWPATAETAAGTLRAAGTVGGTTIDPGAEDVVHPLQRRDHAGCVCGPNQLVVVGGYDGTVELMDVHLCSVVAEPADATSSSSTGGAAEGVDEGGGPYQGDEGGADLNSSSRHDARSSSSSSIRCTATWQPLAPQHGCTPSGRSHHSVCYHEGSGCLYVFGGYSSRGGLLNEVWQFHLGLREWWEPEVTGQGPSHRRSHVAVIIGAHLYVHGGWDGQGHLGDMWRLDLTSWAWEQVAAPGAPSCRRSHAALVLQERFLVVHGGYDGSRYLSDMHVYDTLSQAWICPLLHRSWDQPPAACALHTLTLLGADLVLLGGASSAGLTGQAQVLHSVAAQQGQLLQARLLQLVEDLTAAQQQGVQGEADLECWRLQAAQHEQQLRVLQDSNNALTTRCSSLAADCKHMHKRCAATKAAQEAAAADLASARAQLQAQHAVNTTLCAKMAALERRLARARAAGTKAAAAASGMAATAQAAVGQEQQLLTLQLELRQVAAQAVQQEQEISWLREQLAEAQRSSAALLQQQQHHHPHHGNLVLRSPAGRFSRPAGSPAAMSMATPAAGAGGASELARPSSRALARSGQPSPAASAVDLGSLPPSGPPSPAVAAAAVGVAPSRASSVVWPISRSATAAAADIDGHALSGAAGSAQEQPASTGGGGWPGNISSSGQLEQQQVGGLASPSGQHDLVRQGSPVQQQRQQQQQQGTVQQEQHLGAPSGQVASSPAVALPAAGDASTPAADLEQAEAGPCDPQHHPEQQQPEDSSPWQQLQAEQDAGGGGYTYMEGLAAEDVLDHLQQLQQGLQAQQQEAAASAAEQRSLLQAQLQLTQQAHSLEVHQLQQQLHQAKWRAWSAEADAAQLAAVLAGDPAGAGPVAAVGVPAGAAAGHAEELQQRQQSPAPREGMAFMQLVSPHVAVLDTSVAVSQGRSQLSNSGPPGKASASNLHSSNSSVQVPDAVRVSGDADAPLGGSFQLQPEDSFGDMAGDHALLPEVQELLSLYSRIQSTAV